MTMLDTRDPPFLPAIETVLDIPVPPSVNRTRKINYAALGQIAAWRKHADVLLMASGQLRGAIVNIPRYELEIILDEAKCRIDPDNVLKAAIDYLRRIEVIQDDSPKHARKITVRWGKVEAGCRLIVTPLEAGRDGK